MSLKNALLALAIASASTVASGNYLGLLKPPKSGEAVETGFQAFASPAVLGLSPSLAAPAGYRLKLGYQPSRYFSVEGEYIDYGRNGRNPFASPSSLAQGFRGTGFAVDTVASLPFWNKFSFYGRFGAFRGDAHPDFAPNSSSLLVDASQATRLRYGLGLGYDFTKSLGIRAELERYSPLGQGFPTEAESDLFSVGLRWRF